MLRFVRWFVVLIVVCGSLPAWAAEFFFQDGDVVVMIGDSITEQHLYSNFVEMWTVTRFPNWKLTFRNVGIGGDRAVGGNARFARDVLLHKPTAMTVDFGMNDGGYRAFCKVWPTRPRRRRFAWLGSRRSRWTPAIRDRPR
jgi:hypothetical protein